MNTALSRYEESRREPTARLIASNRQTGPEVVLQMAQNDPSTPMSELEAVLAAYRKLARFDKATVNQDYEAWQAERKK